MYTNLSYFFAILRQRSSNFQNGACAENWHKWNMKKISILLLSNNHKKRLFQFKLLFFFYQTSYVIPLKKSTSLAPKKDQKEEKIFLLQ